MRILCFGDSNTYGYDPRGFYGDRYEAENRWVDLLAAQTGHEAINAGTNGREIPHVSYSRSLELRDDYIFLVMVGTNELLGGMAPKKIAAKMEVFLKPLLPKRQQLLLVAPPPLKRGMWVPADALVEESLRLAEAYRLLAQKLDIPFVDTRSWNVALAFDGVHFSEEGHHTFADNLARELTAHLDSSNG